MLKTLNIGFHGLHISLILFSGLGWLVPDWLDAHMLLQVLILFSWFGLGFFFEPGFCLVTACHWRIRQAGGIRDSTGSYMVLLGDKLFGRRWSEDRTGYITMAIFFVSVLGNCFMRW